LPRGGGKLGLQKEGQSLALDLGDTRKGGETQEKEGSRCLIQKEKAKKFSGTGVSSRPAEVGGKDGGEVSCASKTLHKGKKSKSEIGNKGL